MKKFLTIIFILFLYSCSKDVKKGIIFKKHQSGLKYFFLKENKYGKKTKKGDILTLNLKYSTEKDSVLQNQKNLKMQLNTPSYSGGSIEIGLAMMREGEKIKFKIGAYNFYTLTKKADFPKFLKNIDTLIFEVELLNIQTYQEFAEEKRIIYNSDKEKEIEILENYLKLTNTIIEPTKTGLYYIETKKGKGEKAQNGDIIFVHYIGTFIDGKIFDNSYERKKPFAFTLGKKQVIDAWEEAFLNVQEGTRAKLIIPSKLAYGVEGYENIIPPFASLVFEIEIMKIKK